MRKIALQKLELTNYRNIEHAVLDFDGNSKIVGENRVGKTNTLEAIYWLLTDKLLGGSSEIAAIKPIQDTKREVRVEGTFDIEDGMMTVTLCKVYGENWVKVKGTQELELKGHYTEWYYNGVKQGTYKSYMTLFNRDFDIGCDLGKIEVVRLLIDPTYIGELGESKDWIELRNFIINLIGDVKDDDVFNANPKLYPIQEDLRNVGGRTDQLKKQYKGQIDGLEESIIGNKAQIEMLERLEKPTDEEIAIARKAIEEIDEKIAQLQSIKTTDAMAITYQTKINELQEKYNNKRAELIDNNPLKIKERDLKVKINAKLDEIRRIKALAFDNDDEISDLEYDLQTLNKSVDERTKSREELISYLKDIDKELANVRNDTSLTVCPTCHRPLENAEEIIAKRVEELQNKKAELIDTGKKNTEVLKLEIRKIEDIKPKLAKAKEQYDLNQSQMEKLNDELTKLHIEESELELERNTAKFSDPELESLQKEIDDLKERLIKSKESTANRDAEIRQAIADEAMKKEPYGKILTSLDYYEMQKKQIAKVRDELNTNERKLASVEQKKELINKFIFLKLKMLDERVASVFGNIKFQLISMNLNGGYDAICKPYIYDIDKDQSTNVTWKSGSKSERIVTGIAIAERIKAKLNLPNLPYLFDEGGEISSDTFATKFKTNSQLICVKVQDNINKPIVLKI